MKSSSLKVSDPGVFGRKVEDSTLLSIDNDFSLLPSLLKDLEISLSHSSSSSFMLDSSALFTFPDIGVEEVGMVAGIKSADNKSSPDVQLSKGTQVFSERLLCKILLRSMVTLPRKSSLPISSSNTSTNNS